jgi:hypothetical protein
MGDSVPDLKTPCQKNYGRKKVSSRRRLHSTRYKRFDRRYFFSFLSRLHEDFPYYEIWNKRLHSFGRGVLWSTNVCYTAEMFVMEACICIGRGFLGNCENFGASRYKHYTLFIFVPKSIGRKSVLYIFPIP